LKKFQAILEFPPLIEKVIKVDFIFSFVPRKRWVLWKTPDAKTFWAFEEFLFYLITL
jgi:hypothetical protein